MLTDFGLARMTQYTQAFFQTTTRDATAGSVRWTAYELIPLDLQSGSDDDSLDEEGSPSQGLAAAAFAKPVEQNPINPAVSNGGYNPIVNTIHEYGQPEVKRGDYDEDSEGHHTKETDIWAFGMVIYVRG